MEYKNKKYLSVYGIRLTGMIVLFLIWGTDGLSQVIQPQYFSITEGVSSPVVQTVLQDSYGMLWIGTGNGLQKYNGHRFESFRTVSGNPGSLLHNNVWGLIEDVEKNLWVANEQGISKYNRKKNEFINYNIAEQFNISGLEGGRIFNFYIDSQDKLWGLGFQAGLLFYDPQSDQWNRADYLLDDVAGTINTGDFLLGFAEDSNRRLWAGSIGNGLLVKNRTDSYFSPAEIDEGNRIDFTTPINHITSLYADSANIIWITTRNGIYKYNPESTVLKTITEYDYSQAITLNYWNRILQDNEGNIWISNNFRGILKFDGISDHFEEITVSGISRGIDNRMELVTTDFTIDKSGIFWFGTTSLGLLKYNPVENPFTVYTHDSATEGSISYNGIFGILESSISPGTIYVGTRGGGGLNIFDQQKKTFRQVVIQGVQDMYGGSARTILEEADGSLWVGSWGDGLIKLDPDYREVNRYTHDPDSPNSISNNSVRVIKKDGNGVYWIGTNNGLNLFDPDTGQFKQIQSLLTRSFTKELHELLSQKLLSNSKVAGIEEVEDYQNLTHTFEVEETGRYLIMAVGEGTGDLMFDYGWLEDASNNPVWSAEEINDSYYAGGAFKNRIFIDDITLDAGTYNLRYISDGSHSYENWNQEPPAFTGLWGITVLKLDDSEPDASILSILNQTRDEYSNYRLITGNNIRSIHVSDNSVWIATDNNGLNKIDLDTYTVTTYMHDEADSNTIISNVLLEIYEAPDGILWITTLEGLSRFDPVTEQFTNYTERDGLATNLLSSVIPGDDGNLWITSQSGISHMVTNTAIEKITFVNYFSEDGLGGNSFIPLGSLRASDGMIYFGGDHGLVEFSHFSPNLTPPDIVISDFRIANESVRTMGDDSPVSVSLYDLEEITLSHSQNYFSIDFLALHYANPQKNQYGYMLAGFDDDWIYDNSTSASYANLKPGEYNFIVRASNSDGIWNEDGKSVKITILPPWWLTWWAYSLYLLIFIGGVFTVDRVQRRRIISRERKIALEKELQQKKEIENAYRKLEAAHENLKAAQTQLVQQEKLASLGQLTAGIAHEIKNPLNFVNNFSEVSREMITELREEIDGFLTGFQTGGKTRLISNEQKKSADLILELLVELESNQAKIHEHGTRADSIVKSMLQHSRGGSGKMEPTDLNAMIKEYTNLAFHGMRAGKDPINVDIELDLDEQIGMVHMIAEDFSRVLLNLCNNAFDAMRERLNSNDQAPNSKRYSPKLTVRTQTSNGILIIEVEDNGPGIPDEIKDKILQPFFTTKKGTQGTGLGLSITHDIVKAHGGEILIESKTGRYTKFAIHLNHT
ncbi:MAG: GHKL domain-containing protein [Balneolaceae bacterium]|nr:MAG: GHKL domain-containing protein [Balneolaceae bacterium]